MLRIYLLIKVMRKGDQGLVISTLTDAVSRQVEAVNDSVNEALFEPVIRLGVTGLARAGKTVFITSLVANLLDRGRMPQWVAAAEGRIEAAYLQPQPDDTVARFAYEENLSALTGPQPHWPDNTRGISELRLSLKVRPTGMLSGMRSARTVHIDIVDYPGEWLLDLALLDKSYADWSAQSLGRLSERSEAANFLDLVKGLEAGGRFTEPTAQALARSYTDYLTNARAAGYSDCTPGRFLLPGDLAGSPVLSFAPLPVPEARMPRGSLYYEMQRRYEAYKARVVKPFFRDHFARIDRQVVLVDALGAIHNGPRALEDLRQSMTDILAAFRPGRNAFLTRLMRGKRVEKILFAATKSDHLHHSQHPQLSAIVQALVRQARDRADFSGAQTHALALASLRTTTEARLSHEGREVDCVQGILLNEGKRAAFYPGALPEDPAQLLAPARQGAAEWLDQDYAVMRFAPASLSLRPGEGPPHIRLDRAVQFLIGDRL